MKLLHSMRFPYVPMEDPIPVKYSIIAVEIALETKTLFSKQTHIHIHFQFNMYILHLQTRQPHITNAMSQVLYSIDI